jgi:Zn-dependent protease with chaperone function
MTKTIILIAVLAAPALVCALVGLIRFPRRSGDKAMTAERRWTFMRRMSFLLVISWFAYGIAVWSIMRGRFFLSPFLLDGFFLHYTALYTFANFLYVSLITALALVPLILAYIVYLFSFLWVDRRMRSESFSLRGATRIMLFEGLHRLLPYALLFMFALSDATPWIIAGRNIVSFNIPIALFVLASCSFLYIYSFRIAQAMIRVFVPVEDSALEQRAAELAAKAGVKAGRIRRLKTFGYPYAQGYAVMNGDIFLSDRVLDDFPPPEREAVLAHEIGHLRHIKALVVKHILTYTAWVLALIFIQPLGDVLFANSLIVLLFKVGLIYGCLLLTILMNKASRRHELEADQFSASAVGEDVFIRAMERLHEVNMLPRHFDKKGREKMTHPSLEVRTSAVRQTGAAPAVEKAPSE